MTIQNMTPQAYQPLVLGEWPCEGGEEIKIPITLDGSGDPVNIDLSVLQNTGHFSAAQTIFIDNSLNPQSTTFVCNGSFQTFTVPPFGFMYMPILAPNPPKFVLTSTGAVKVVVHFINFFLPPIIWGPSIAGSSGSVVAGTPNDHSGNVVGAPLLAIAANPNRVGFIVSNPSTATEKLQMAFGNTGHYIDLAPGATYETGILVWKGDIYLNAATNPHAFVAYEATSP